MPAERDYASEIREAKTKVAALVANRESLIRDEATEAQKVKESQLKLEELGIENADSMTVEELRALAAQKQVELDKALTQIQAQIAKGEQVMAEYEKVTKEA